MPRVVHFEIHAEQPERAIRFYSQLFGWEFKRWEGPLPYWLITTGPDSQPGINGGLILRRGAIDGQAVTAYVCTVDVADLKAILHQIGDLGGTVVLPTMPVPQVGWLAYAKDTEGNIFGVMEPDPAAGTQASLTEAIDPIVPEV